MAAQEVHLVPDEPACAECRIDLSRLLDVGRVEGPGIIDWRGGQALAAVDSRGHIYLRGFFSTHVKAYDGEGRFLATIGREGEGPGEFKGVNGIAVGPADSLYVFDVLTMRLSIFSPDHMLVRSAPLQIRPSGLDPIVVPWDPDHFYLSSHMRTAELIGWPIHRIDRTGTRSASFGSETGEFSPSQPYSGQRIIADAGEGTLWAGRVAHYVIQRVAPGERAPMVEIRREADWFPEPSPEDLVAHSTKRPPPLLAAIRQDGKRLWVLSWVPDPAWRTASAELEDEHRRYDSVIEVIDLEDYRVLSRIRVDELYHQFLGRDRIGGTVFESGYFPIYRIMRMTLTEAPSP